MGQQTGQTKIMHLRACILSGIFAVASFHNIATGTDIGDHISDVGRCIASMTLYDVDANRHLDLEEFIQVYSHVGGCPSRETSAFYEDLAKTCFGYDDDPSCNDKGIALVGVYPVSYTNAVCIGLLRQVTDELNVEGTVATLPPLSVEEEKSVEDTSPVSWRIATFASLGVAICLVALVLFVKIRSTENFEQGAPRTLGILCRSSPEADDRDDIILSSARVFESPSKAPSFLPECIPEEPQSYEDSEDDD